MPKYFMHLVDSVDILLDTDGTEMAPETIPAKALFCSRDCMANDVKDGRLDLRYRIEVHNESGQVVHCLEFADAVEIVGTHYSPATPHTGLDLTGSPL